MNTIHSYSSKSNAIRAARKELGSDAQNGMDFRVVPVEGGFTWERVITAAEGGDTIPAGPVSDPFEDKARVGEAIMDVVRA